MLVMFYAEFYGSIFLFYFFYFFIHFIVAFGGAAAALSASFRLPVPAATVGFCAQLFSFFFFFSVNPFESLTKSALRIERFFF